MGRDAHPVLVVLSGHDHLHRTYIVIQFLVISNENQKIQEPKTDNGREIDVNHQEIF